VKAIGKSDLIFAKSHVVKDLNGTDQFIKANLI
jgi:hypothetical protein